MNLTAAEIAAFLGITPSAVRQIVRRHEIHPVGKDGRANLYDPEQVIEKAGSHDRRAA